MMQHVFDIIKTLKPSDRGELEITDVNNQYIEKGLMTWDILEGWWTDAGTFESLLRANQLVAQTGANQDFNRQFDGLCRCANSWIRHFRPEI